MHTVIRWPPLLAVVLIVSVGLLVAGGVVLAFGGVTLVDVSGAPDAIRPLF